MLTIHLLTWNLKERDGADEVLADHLSSLSRRGTPFVVAVQESAPSAEEISRSVRDRGAAVESVGNGTMSVICSEPLEAIGDTLDPVGRRLVLTRASFAGQRIAIANYHGNAQRMAGAVSLEERGGIASEARWRIDAHAAGDPVIVLGDFNAEPHAPEIAGGHCFSFAQDPHARFDRSHGRPRGRLRAVGARCPPGVDGTYSAADTMGRRWSMIDFIVASAGLDVVTEIVNQLAGKPLVKNGRPAVSDHLPVAGTLTLP